MARLRNSTFQGSPISDVDIDQLTFKRVIGNAIGDVALTDDILTGDNSPPAGSTIDHSGLDGSLYRGTPLGVPLIQCVWPSGSLLRGPNLFHAVGNEVFAAVVPFLLPRGETSIDVVVGTDTTSAMVAEVYSTAMNLNSRGFLSPTGAPETLAGRVRGLTGGTRYILALRLYADTTIEGRRMTSLFVGWTRRARSPTLSMEAQAGSPFSLPVTVVVDGGGNATVPRLQSFDEALVADARAISAYHLSRLNRNENALEEYLTGAPCAGNASYTLEDSDAGATHPSRSAFHDHSRSGKSNEPLVDFPLWSAAWGGIAPDGTLAEFGGGWEPPGLISSTVSTFCNAPLYIPDGPGDSGSSILEVVVIACSPGADAPSVTLHLDCFDEAGTSAGADVALFAAISGTVFLRAIATAVPFHPDTYNLLRLRADPSSSMAVDGTSFRILGACAHLKAA